MIVLVRTSFCVCRPEVALQRPQRLHRFACAAQGLRCSCVCSNLILRVQARGCAAAASAPASFRVCSARVLQQLRLFQRNFACAGQRLRCSGSHACLPWRVQRRGFAAAAFAPTSLCVCRPEVALQRLPRLPRFACAAQRFRCSRVCSNLHLRVQARGCAAAASTPASLRVCSAEVSL